MNDRHTPIALTIAASDPTGGAGIQADLQTFQHFGVRGLSVITAVTAQNSKGVHAVSPMMSDVIEAQLTALKEEYRFDAIKIGVFSSADAVKVITQFLEGLSCPIVIDPVIRPTRGAELAPQFAVMAMIQHLLPRTTLLTPNIPEAEYILQQKIRSFDDMADAARALMAMRPQSVLVKGGHLKRRKSVRDLFFDGEEHWFESPRIDAELHGSGCRLSSAIASQLALGSDIIPAIGIAREYVRQQFQEQANLLHLS